MPGVLTSRRSRLGLIGVAVAGLLAGLVPWPAVAGPLDDRLAPLGVGSDVFERPNVAPIVFTGAQLPQWSQLPAVAVHGDFGSSLQGPARNAHAGRVEVPPADPRTGVDPETVVAFRYEGGRWIEVPVQVDERFPYFLANASSDFGMYSRSDVELSYEWDVESWKRTAGVCTAQYPAEQTRAEDPVRGFDDDDELVFMPSDAGPEQAPAAARGPAGTGTTRQEIVIADPLAPGAHRYVYLFTRAAGSSLGESDWHVRYERDANADQWIDRTFFDEKNGDPEQLGTSNTGYGPNLSGTVCPDGTPASAKASSDRFPRDGVTVSTDTYEWRATGRWMVRGLRVTKPGFKGTYGADLIDRRGTTTEASRRSTTRRRSRAASTSTG
ncbi:MAG TPA: hypothetical protein VM345_08235 [Acidimicrobiales bacterium]|jgi:hypothetical protein|nr:hypothetical protein [Acidimicrobiales bacterium]